MKNESSSHAAFRKLLPTRSQRFREAVRTVEKTVTTDANLLILGESGVGKDYVAEAVHVCGPRRNRPLVRIDCAALSADLFESELFGYEKGAFTDARAMKAGKLELAQNGTVYLDEVTSLSPQLQGKLLRVIQEKQFYRLGGSRMIRLNVRVISSSNRRLPDLIEKGTFRQDLYYRLNVVSVTLPPLRERREDIMMLANRFLKESARHHGRKIEAFSPEANAMLMGHSWPGNVRELRNVVDRSVILEETEVIWPRSLPMDHFGKPEDVVARAVSSEWTLEQLERHYIAEVLRRTAGNYSRAAQILGINRKTLLEKRKRYGIE